MFDIKKVEEEAKQEVAKEAASQAKARIVTSLKAIQRAESVVDNLKREHEVLMRTIGA